MIAYLEGVLNEKAPMRSVVNVGGVGYEVFTPLSTFYELPDLGKSVALRIYTHVREDLIQLFGFYTLQERQIFELLLRANGIGPRLAQTILSGMAPGELVQAIRSGDVAALRAIPGLGLKKAERLVLELRDRVLELSEDTGHAAALLPVARTGVNEKAGEQALSALLNLGYPRAQAERVVQEAVREEGPEAAVEPLIRSALRRLSR